MARRKSRKAKSPSAQLGHKSQGLGSAALAAARRQVAQLEAEREARGQMTARERKNLAAREARARDREYRAKIAELQKLGLYAPRATPADIRHASADVRETLRLRPFAPLRAADVLLTPARMRSINRAWRQAENLGTGAVFAPMPGKASAEDRATIRREVERAGGRVTRTGVFLPRAEREMRQPAGRLVYDRSLGLWTVKVSKTVGRKGDRRTITEIRPLAGQDALEKTKNKFIKKFDKAEFNSKKERLRFIIHGRNVSRRSFRSLLELFNYAEGYRKAAAAQATFLNSLTIIRVTRNTSGEWMRPTGKLAARGKWADLDEDEMERFDEDEE